jgi:gluconolactonase
MSNYEGHKAAFKLPANVYRLDPKTREATVVATDMDKSNGIRFSPDEKKLYIVDNRRPQAPNDPHSIRVYDDAAAKPGEWDDGDAIDLSLFRDDDED